MIGLLLIYFLGKNFYKLAERYKKNKGLFAVLGVGSYYLGSFIGGFVLVIVLELLDVTIIDDFNDLQLSLIALPFGLLGSYIFYKLLERNWKKTQLVSADVLDNEY